MYFRVFYSLGLSGVLRQKVRRFDMAVAVFIIFQVCMVNGAFAQRRSPEHDKIQKAENRPRAQNSIAFKIRRQVELEVNLGKIYIMPPELSQKSEQERIEKAQNDLLNLYRERQLIQRTLDRLEKRASDRQKRAKKKTRRPCV